VNNTEGGRIRKMMKMMKMIKMTGIQKDGIEVVFV
jgi:membrane-bound ClpP family serine protease